MSKCVFKDCKTRSHYNYENEKKALYCNTHKLPNMINIITKTCIFEDCKIIPNYNYENEKKALYCSKHKLPNMINIKDKTCVFEDCKIIPCYNYENEKIALYCYKHKLPNMINIKSKTCIFEDCKIQPCYNYENEKTAIYCSKHKLPNMINIKGKTCLSKWCSTRVINKYEGYCQYCYFNLFPDKPITRNYKTKEKAVADFIKEQFPNIDIQTDKKIIDGCSRRRPDVFIDVGFQVIIVEIDENQHISYDCSCENKRIMEISQDIQHRPIVFIRFNPDDYEINGIKNKSCWEINKNTGICFIKKSKINEWNNRLKQLKETISYWMDINNCTDKIIEVIQLYYDE